MIHPAKVVRLYQPEGDYDYQWTCDFCGTLNEETDFNSAPYSHVAVCKHCQLPGQSIEFKRS